MEKTLKKAVVEKATELMTRQCYLENAQCKSVCLNISELNPSRSVEDYLYDEMSFADDDDDILGGFISELLNCVDKYRP